LTITDGVPGGAPDADRVDNSGDDAPVTEPLLPLSFSLDATVEPDSTGDVATGEPSGLLSPKCCGIGKGDGRAAAAVAPTTDTEMAEAGAEAEGLALKSAGAAAADAAETVRDRPRGDPIQKGGESTSTRSVVSDRVSGRQGRRFS
jgi:hypothetical protein